MKTLVSKFYAYYICTGCGYEKILSHRSDELGEAASEFPLVLSCLWNNCGGRMRRRDV